MTVFRRGLLFWEKQREREGKLEDEEEEEGKNLKSTYLVFFPIQLMDDVVAFLIDDAARRRFFS